MKVAFLGKMIGIPNFDELASFELGQQTTITGVPTHGKSEFMDFLACKLSTIHGWKFGVFSPENYPLQLHVSKLAEKLIGKPFNNKFKMTKEELHLAKEYVEDNFFF